MIKFNLEKALAGDNIMTVKGEEVTQFVGFDLDNEYRFYGVLCGGLESWNKIGKYTLKDKYTLRDKDHPNDLVMVPKRMEGFLNVNSNTCSSIHESKDRADFFADGDRVACIDLSLFPIGYGILSGRK